MHIFTTTDGLDTIEWLIRFCFMIIGNTFDVCWLFEYYSNIKISIMPSIRPCWCEYLSGLSLNDPNCQCEIFQNLRRAIKMFREQTNESIASFRDVCFWKCSRRKRVCFNDIWMMDEWLTEWIVVNNFNDIRSYAKTWYAQKHSIRR